MGVYYFTNSGIHDIGCLPRWTRRRSSRPSGRPTRGSSPPPYTRYAYTRCLRTGVDAELQTPVQCTCIHRVYTQGSMRCYKPLYVIGSSGRRPGTATSTPRCSVRPLVFGRDSDQGGAVHLYIVPEPAGAVRQMFLCCGCRGRHATKCLRISLSLSLTYLCLCYAGSGQLQNLVEEGYKWLSGRL